jgi:hypothetical protein
MLNFLKNCRTIWRNRDTVGDDGKIGVVESSKIVAQFGETVARFCLLDAAVLCMT